jgi:hypothetical protein
MLASELPIEETPQDEFDVATNALFSNGCIRLVFSQSFYPSTSKNLELKGKKNCNPSMKRLKEKQPVPKPVISIPTRPRKG